MKLIPNFLGITAFFLIIVGCDKKKEEFSLNEPSRTYQELKKLALTKGDTIAYHELSIAYMDSPNDDRFLNIALIMANRYNIPEAYLDVYYFLTDYYHRKDFKNLDDLDDNTRALALAYLKKGAERGDKECQKILGHYYIEGKYFNKDTIKGNQLITEGER